MDDNNTDIGKACGVTYKHIYHKNFRIITIPIPLPASSSNINQMACITNTNITMENEAKNGTKKLLIKYLSKVFNKKYDYSLM